MFTRLVQESLSPQPVIQIHFLGIVAVRMRSLRRWPLPTVPLFLSLVLSLRLANISEPESKVGLQHLLTFF